MGVPAPTRLNRSFWSLVSMAPPAPCATDNVNGRLSLVVLPEICPIPSEPICAHFFSFALIRDIKMRERGDIHDSPIEPLRKCLVALRREEHHPLTQPSSRGSS